MDNNDFDDHDYNNDDYNDETKMTTTTTIYCHLFCFYVDCDDEIKVRKSLVTTKIILKMVTFRIGNDK